ncbi:MULTISPECIES: glycosyltransferase [Paenibacillus]|jgi:GT2 family glycosyltransferase|uniref:Glycosyltransferase n=2 Tax=Paenibacillus TaxID=44249 RepID=A0ABX2ZEZ5_PAEPO|nr:MULTISPECIES: glycosyltransferase [Paenibacillus]MBP1173302.1 GT2 family glycosyltransferase [Paenibacillus sp. PvR133]MDR6778951.1 GT2 family glycosyltransferase [Paenibacillus peoriae]MXO77306.1 glycosyltransferase [Paenibacillus sp. OT2-17]ODA09563.1 glycosyltransferase [Paenibacillus polymyxa]OME67925.1 glycosyltransferase [Paenibacillus peoriae]
MEVRSCDIIIPVYNAPEELEECVQSLFRYTNLKENRVVIINDCSPDSKVNEYLATLDKQEGLIILQNEKNLGFVGTVNRGMSFSQDDVVLLNSDTVVTAGWLEKLKEVAYLDESIATVTPLTNNGSICSVPKFLEDNSIPEGYTVESFAHFIENISLKEYPEVPTAVGFCMYIKRVIIDEVGLFDQETFGKGYAEENDFCCRVIEHGYKNVIDDHTFIYHKGSMSFKGDKLALLNKNLKTLNARYPYYDKNVHDFIVKNPLKRIHENINIRLPHYVDSYKTRGNILYVLHNFFDESYTQPIGGTEYHVKDIVSELEDYYAFVLVTNGNELVLKQYLKGDFIAKYHFPLRDSISIQHFHHQEYSEIVEKILGTFEISLVHIHHLIRHSFDIPHIAHKLNIPVIFTLHDYYLFSPKVNLLDENNKYILESGNEEEKFNSSLRAAYGFHTPFIKKWREKVEGMTSKVDQFITPCDFSKDLFIKYFPSLENKISAIEHGVTIENNLTGSEISYVKSEEKEIKEWNIGFLGGLAPNKGSDLIYKLITKYPRNHINWHLVGGLGDQKLNLLNQNNLHKHGEYKREELSHIIKQLDLDLICLLSPWPETFSYTLTEAWLHDIPVLVTPMGALKERVNKVGGGWVSQSLELSDVMKKMDEIIDHGQNELAKIKINISEYNFKTKLEMVAQYKELYDRFESSKEPIKTITVFDNADLLVSLKYYFPHDSNITSHEYHNQLNQLETELMNMRNTIGWKVLTKLRNNNKGSLKMGKKLIYFILKFKASKR